MVDEQQQHQQRPRQRSADGHRQQRDLVALLGAFQALSEPLRLETVELLRDRELCVGELCDALAVAQSKISFHLKVLRQAELILGRQEGRWVYYRLNLPQFARLEQYLAELRRFSPMVPPGSREGSEP